MGQSGAAAGNRAFLWTAGGGMQNLGALPGFPHSAAYGVNNAGQVVGSSNPFPAGIPRAFRWTARGGMQELVTPDTFFSDARSINDAGDVVGTAGLNGTPFAFGWTAGGGGQFLDQDIEFPQGVDVIRLSAASGINNAGQVVGSIAFGTEARAALWTGGSLQSLGVLPDGDDFAPESNAWGINDAGQVVGSATVSGRDHAFLWTAAGGMQDLNALIDPLDPLKGVTTLVWARDINNVGQIVGFGIINGKNHAYLLTPVPEPETYAMMVAGLGLLGFMLRRRRAAARLPGA